MSADHPWLVRGGALVLAGVLGAGAGCPFELERGLSCGDGWWDPEFEECDPRDPASYLDACRKQGIEMDATCDPQTCTIRSCVPVCGDGFVLSGEECDIGVHGEAPESLCSAYQSTAHPYDDKPYASGHIGDCNTDYCTFGRDECSFCGDGQLDGAYLDIKAKLGKVEFPAERCDGDEVDPALLHNYCMDQCVAEGFNLNSDVFLECEFECTSDCSDIELADIDLDPQARRCCIAAGSPCPIYAGVPDLPCCSWPDEVAPEGPEWEPSLRCSDKDSDPSTAPFYVCN